MWLQHLKWFFCFYLSIILYKYWIHMMNVSNAGSYGLDHLICFLSVAICNNLWFVWSYFGKEMLTNRWKWCHLFPQSSPISDKCRHSSSGYIVLKKKKICRRELSCILTTVLHLLRPDLALYTIELGWDIWVWPKLVHWFHLLKIGEINGKVYIWGKVGSLKCTLNFTTLFISN